MSLSPNTTSNNSSDIDLVKELFDYFDSDKNGFLSFVEVASLQQVTSGVKMTSDQYALACKTLECHPNMGLTLKELRWTYAAEGSNVEEDYQKVFGKPPPRKKKETNKDKVYEVTEEGFDVSPS